MTYRSDNMWNCESAVSELRDADGRPMFDVPAWIDADITPQTVASIEHGGCASGAYMPAVTYCDAAQTMAQHGDDVMDYLADHCDELPAPDIADHYGELPPYNAESWSGVACHYLSIAVELWAISIADELERVLDDAARPDGDNPARRALTAAVNKAVASGAPVFTEQRPDAE